MTLSALKGSGHGRRRGFGSQCTSGGPAVTNTFTPSEICEIQYACPFVDSLKNCSQLDSGERALVRGMRTQVEKMILRHPEGCEEALEEEDD